MRLQPIERPPGPLMRFACWMSRRQLGPVARPLKAVYARVPALASAEEVTREKRVDDATFERLRKHFNEREIVEVTWVNALANYYNLINVPLELEADGLCAIAQGRARA